MFKSGLGPCYILVALKCMKDLELGQCLLKYVNVQETNTQRAAKHCQHTNMNHVICLSKIIHKLGQQN